MRAAKLTQIKTQEPKAITMITYAAPTRRRNMTRCNAHRLRYSLRAAVWNACVAALLATTASPLLAADVARGRALYENHCGFCHTPKIHSRANKLPATKNEVRLMVDDWRRQSNLAWTPEEIEDVVEYLNATRYKFAPD